MKRRWGWTLAVALPLVVVVAATIHAGGDHGVRVETGMKDRPLGGWPVRVSTTSTVPEVTPTTGASVVANPVQPPVSTTTTAAARQSSSGSSSTRRTTTTTQRVSTTSTAPKQAAPPPPATTTTTVPPPPPTTTTTAPQPRVEIWKGGPANGAYGCTHSSCRYIHVRLVNFGGGSHRFGCWNDSGEFAVYYTSSPDSETCVYGYPNERVWVAVDGHRSNDIIW
jgi:hypothetical protein